MKTYTEYLSFNTKEKIEIKNITKEVEKAVKKSEVKEGICLVNSMHTTSSVFINDDERGLKNDFEKLLGKMVPYDVDKYEHNKTGEDNAYAHIRRTFMGRGAVVAITNCKLDFGPWEQIFYGEFDGQRKKRALIKILGE